MEPSDYKHVALGLIFRNWVDAIERNKQESRTLAQLRDTLLPKLTSGELRITDAENCLKGIAQ